MTGSAIRASFDLRGAPVVDAWLRFAPPVQARYDAEHGARRRADLRRAILIGLALYNVYNLTGLVLMPDILWLSVALRAAVVTPTSLALAWAIGRTPPEWTERLVFWGSFNAYLVPVFLFWLTGAPQGLFTFGELPLTIVFANMTLTLRFRHAVLFTAGALGVTLGAVWLKAGLDPSLQAAFAVQIATACLFALYANHRTERRRCEDYVAALDARLEAAAAETASRRFRDLSRTDALTGLPNRRHLAERLEAWFADGSPVAVLMIDVDHFKLYNDAFGHPQGDDCLRRVAGALEALAQGNDLFCARFGGEEFTVVLRGATELEAARLARALLQGVEGLAIPHPGRGHGLCHVTISIGLALREAGGLAPDAAMAAADEALYLAKRRGRNRFVVGEAAKRDAARRG